MDRAVETNKRAHLHHMMHAMFITQGQIIKGMANPVNTRPDWAMVFGIDFTAVFVSTIFLATRFVFGRRIVGWTIELASGCATSCGSTFVFWLHDSV